jgi:putative resolvase
VGDAGDAGDAQPPIYSSCDSGRLLVANPIETTDDLVRDMVEVLTSFCARLYGRRGARNRALRALTAAKRGA